MYKNDNVSFSPFSLRFENVYSIPINNTKSNKKRNDATAAATTRLFTARIITLLPSCLYLAAFTAAIIVFALPRKGSIITTLLSLILLNRTEVQNTILTILVLFYRHVSSGNKEKERTITVNVKRWKWRLEDKGGGVAKEKWRRVMTTTRMVQVRMLKIVFESSLNDYSKVVTFLWRCFSAFSSVKEASFM